MSRFLCILELLTVSVSLALVTQLSACDDEPLLSDSANVIVAFDLRASLNPTLPEDVRGTVEDREVWLDVPADTDVTSLVPTIIYRGRDITPTDNAPQDFSDPITYTVTAQDGGRRTYTVSVVKSDGSTNDIRVLRVNGVAGTIDGQNISVTLPHGTDVSSLRVLVNHNGKSVIPENDTLQDFTQPVEFTVTAQNGSEKTYTVTVNVASDSAKDITAFAIDGRSADINDTQITLTLPSGTDRSQLAPELTITGVSVSPDSGEQQDFSDPVVYTVTAADGSTKEYTAVVSVAQASDKNITRFTVKNKDAVIDGNSIKLTLPSDTDLTKLEATVQHTGKSVSPASGGVRDFSSPVTYTVTAEDGSTKAYSVEIKKAASSAKDITSFEIAGATGVITGTDIAITVPYNSTKSNLTPTIDHQGAGVEPQSGVAHDFTSPVDFTVTAADGSTKVYRVTVTVATEDAKEIKNFKIGDYVGQYTGNSITVAVSVSANVTSLAPTFTIVGASVAPMSNEAKNFTSPVMYTVTAADGSTRIYTVTVTKTLSDAKQITQFDIGTDIGKIDQNAHTITVTWTAASRANLSPSITHTGVSIDPASNAQQTFDTTVPYTVTAADGSSQAYDVKVIYAKNCRALLTDKEGTPSGTYLVDPDGQDTLSSLPPFQVYCDMTEDDDGGGWTLIGKTAAGDYSGLSDEDYVDLIANPTDDVDGALLLDDAAPTAGKIAFFNKAKTNALYHTISGPRTVRIEQSGNIGNGASDGTYYQQRVTATASDWDFWHALRDSRLWNRDASVNGGDVAYFGVDFTLTKNPLDFDKDSNVVTHGGDSDFGWWSEDTLTTNGGPLKVSRHMGLICDGAGSGFAWLLTSDSNDYRFRNDVGSAQKNVIWLR
jgi:hypothetical protein